jgi:murein L,D-transpeptidase YcbB/YkuD
MVPRINNILLTFKSFSSLALLAIAISIGFFSCQNVQPPKENDIVKNPKNLEERVNENLKRTIKYALGNRGRIADTILIHQISLVDSVYQQNNYQPLWSNKESWGYLGTVMFSFIERSKEYGLFPSDYHYRSLNGIRASIETDTVARRNAALWSRADLMLTDAFLLMSKHLKKGRIPYDTLDLHSDSLNNNEVYLKVLQNVINTKNLSGTFQQLEPRHKGYDSLKAGLRKFLDSAQFSKYTYLYYPFKDSIAFYKSLQMRLWEEDIIESATVPMDEALFKAAIMKYQTAKGLKPIGKLNEAVVSALNNTDWEKFKRIAINLDRFKSLPDTLPKTYVWVNIPSYTLYVFEKDTMALDSRVIVGDSKTKTPQLSSDISNFVTYPQWTVPMSIIFKEMLPAIRKDIGYLSRQNLMVVDKNDSIINPYSINWYKLNKKYFPYLLKQRQGDDNSLGVMKFNFRNKYSVYLHDTNARWLFGKSNRALSHGCVRVKEWEKLAHFLVRNDTIRYHPDTLRAWIGRQEKHYVGVPKTPIFIRYFSCEGKNGKVKFYDDIYGEDRALRERYFADKSIN